MIVMPRICPIPLTVSKGVNPSRNLSCAQHYRFYLLNLFLQTLQHREIALHRQRQFSLREELLYFRL